MTHNFFGFQISQSIHSTVNHYTHLSHHQRSLYELKLLSGLVLQSIIQFVHAPTCLPADELPVLLVVIDKPRLQGLEVLADDRSVHLAAANQCLQCIGPLL